MMKKKESIIIVVLLLTMIIAVIGVSYAAFNYSSTGTKLNSITTGYITMSYEESSNTINLTGALPTTDETGKTRLTEGEYFDFTVSSEIKGNININYEISAKDVTTSDRKIGGSNIKLYLTRLTDSGEEELMEPKVYNEETEENSYTGRPAGEMSLYTSSMSSSESNRYRLRMYVTEEYNPQGDGGGLEFSVRINVYGKDGKKPNAANTLIAKANAENLNYNSATSEQQKEMWTFSHPVTVQTEALTDYRYIGATPNNYVTFNNELWRIIGVFTVDDGTGKEEERLKIIRDESIGDMQWNSTDYNNWSTATLNNYLNEDYYNNLSNEAKDMIGDAKYYLGGIPYGATEYYNYERGEDVSSRNALNWIGKVGLMYPSDYIYTFSLGIDDICYSDGSNCDTGNAELSYLYNSSVNQWLISPSNSFSSNQVSNILSTGKIHLVGVRCGSAISTYAGDPYTCYYQSNNFGVRPVVFLKSNVNIIDGDGSSSSPYQLIIK